MMASREIRLIPTTMRRMPVLAQSQDTGQGGPAAQNQIQDILVTAQAIANANENVAPVLDIFTYLAESLVPSPVRIPLRIVNNVSQAISDGHGVLVLADPDASTSEQVQAGVGFAATGAGLALGAPAIGPVVGFGTWTLVQFWNMTTAIGQAWQNQIEVIMQGIANPPDYGQ